MFLVGEESVTCLEVARRCNMDGSEIAVVMLCLPYVEREFATQLFAAGWEPAKKAPLLILPLRGYDDRVLSARDWDIYRGIADLKGIRTHTSVRRRANRCWPVGASILGRCLARCSRGTQDGTSWRWHGSQSVNPADASGRPPQANDRLEPCPMPSPSPSNTNFGREEPQCFPQNCLTG